MSVTLRRIAAGLLVVALLLASGSVVGAAWLARDAQWVQRVEPSSVAETSLFGSEDGGTRIGSPQLVIIRDQAAFLPGRTPGGARLVNEQYLREQEIYPLQAKTVWFMRNSLLLGALALFSLAIAVGWWARRAVS